MEIPPKVAYWLNIIYGLAIAVATGALKLTGIVPAKELPLIIQWAGIVAFLMNIVMHGYSGQQPGPLTKSYRALKAAGRLGALLVGLGAASYIYGTLPAHAQAAPPGHGVSHPIGHLATHPCADDPKKSCWDVTAAKQPETPKGGGAWILPKPRDPVAPPAPSSVEDLATFLANFAVSDLQAAAANAAAQNPPDATSMACWNGLIPIVQMIQSQIPDTNGGKNPIGIAMAVQLARDLINAPTSPVLKQVNLACAPLYVDTKVGILNFGANLAGALSAAAILGPIKPVPLPIP